MSINYQRAKEIFLIVCDLPADSRRAIIDRECAGDAALRQEVQSLLTHHDAEHSRSGGPPNADPPKRLEDVETMAPAARPGSGYATPRAGESSFAVQTGAPHPAPDTIGPYKIIKRIGVGGMGLVYLASRDDDKFRKRVAIKVIKKGMDSDEILRRFEQERQVLSALNHPNIARMLDGGSTENGRPYFVMEYIEGSSITDYANNNRLRIEERLHLFSTLCQAVHHAHQNLIVHRDIKPSNVVVTQDGTLKLLDFGIAKLLNPELAIFANEPTATNFRLMTPEYASPEQVRGDPLSTASDVYSLGVLLYELVTGRRPYRFKTRLQSEIERVICNEDPERPSTAISHAVQAGEVDSLGEPVKPSAPVSDESTIEEIAKLRDLKPDRLRRRLSGDLDNMILLAMRKEPRRRYTSAEQFAADIRRHLEGMPVIAHPPTPAYRFTKFVHRNKAGVAAAAVMVMLLIAWAVSASLLYREANAQRLIAETNQREADAQRTLAVQNEATANEQRVLAVNARDKAINLQRVTSGLLAELPITISRMPGATEIREKIVATAQEFMKDFEKIAGETADDRDIAYSFMQLGDLQGSQRSGNLGNASRARESYAAGMKIWERLAAAYPADIEINRNLANAYIRVADLSDEGEAVRTALYQKAMHLAESISREKTDDEAARLTKAMALDGLGALQSAQGNSKEAAKIYGESLAIREELHQKYPDNAAYERSKTIGMVRLAELLEDNGQVAEAQVQRKDILDVRQRLFDANPTDVQRRRDLGTAAWRMGENLFLQNKWQEAQPFLENARVVFAQLHEEEPTNARAQRDLAYVQMALGDLASRESEGHPDADIRKDLIQSARDWYALSVSNLEPSKSNQNYRAYLAQILRNRAKMDEAAGDLTAAILHATESLDHFIELKSAEQISEAEALLLRLQQPQ